ncbi:MAG: cytochrome P450 [Chloroflexi bacterium]|nr:cytochrome P450 [Chloroflexota bacterium]
MTTQAVTTMAVKAPPRAPGLPIIGNLLNMRTSSGSPVQYLTQVAAEYGDIVQLSVLGRRLYLVSHPDLLHEIYVKRYSEFHKPTKISDKPRNLGRFLGMGILTADHVEWRPQRKLIQPLMHAKHIESYADDMAAAGERLLASWSEGEVRNLHEDMMQVTLWIISKLMFGMDAGFRADLEDLSRRAQTIAMADTVMDPPGPFGRRRDRKAQDVNDGLDALVDEIVTERKRKGHDGSQDLLWLLMQTRDEDGNPASDDFIRNNILTLYFAGHETTANTLTWTLYLLEQHPDVKAKLHAEVDRVLAGRAPTLADLPNLPYTEMVIKEAMRYEPTVSTIPRYITDDVELGGYTLKAGSIILTSPYQVHHDPR